MGGLVGRPSQAGCKVLSKDLEDHMAPGNHSVG
jgi:hypothetical protein